MSAAPNQNKSVIPVGISLARAYSLIGFLYCACFATLLFVSAGKSLLTLVHIAAFAVIVVNYIVLEQTGNYRRCINVVLATGMVVVVALFATGGWQNSGYLWPFAYLPFAAFVTNRKNSGYWVFALVAGCLAMVVLHVLNVITIPYSPVELFNYFAAIGVFSAGIFVYQKSTIDYESFLAYSSSVLDTQTDPFFMVDANGTVVDINKAAEKYTGLSRPDIIGSQFSSYFSEPLKANEICSKVFLDGTASNFPLLLTAGENIIPVLFNATLYTDETTGVRRVFATARDVTEQIKAEQALRESEERLRLLVEGVTDYAIFMVDPDGYVMSWNKGAERIKGYSAKDILGKHISVFYTDEERKRDEPAHNLQMAREHGEFESEGWRVKKDGTLFWADVLFTPLYDGTGKLRGFSKITRDITERRNAQNAMARQAALIQMLPDGVLYGDMQGRIVSLNAGAENMFEMKAADVIGKTIDEVVQLNLKGTTREANRIDLATKGTARMEAEITNRNGKKMVVLGTVKLITDAETEPGWVAIYTDISPLKLNEELKEALKKLEASNQYMEQLAYISAHDIKSPIIALDGLADILINSNAVKPEYAEVLKMFKSTISQMQRTNHSLNNILKLRKNLLRKEDVSDQTFSLKSIIEDVRLMLQSNLDDAKAVLVVNLDGVSEIHFPYVHIKSIFSNLLTNAIKYRDPERPLVINIQAQKHDAGFAFVISDNGMGINLDLNKDKLFGIFKRFHDHVEGSGVGLHIVKSIVDAYGGTITVESEEGKGTSFKISFNNTISL